MFVKATKLAKSMIQRSRVHVLHIPSDVTHHHIGDLSPNIIIWRISYKIIISDKSSVKSSYMYVGSSVKHLAHLQTSSHQPHLSTLKSLESLGTRLQQNPAHKEHQGMPLVTQIFSSGSFSTLSFSIVSTISQPIDCR